MTAPAHLKLLEGAGLIARRREGRVHHLQLESAPLGDAIEWIVRYGRFWEERLDALERILTKGSRARG